MSRNVQFALVCGLAALAWVAGCGEVDIVTQDGSPLRLIDLSPHDGELDVPAGSITVAVFSSPMRFGGEDNQINETTFFVHAAGAESDRLAGTLAPSAFDELCTETGTQCATVVFTPNVDAMQAGADYNIVIRGSLAGEDTTSLGVDIRSGFTVAQ